MREPGCSVSGEEDVWLKGVRDAASVLEKVARVACGGSSQAASGVLNGMVLKNETARIALGDREGKGRQAS